MRISISPRIGNVRPTIRTNVDGKIELSTITYNEDGTFTTLMHKLPTTKQMQKTSLALGKLAIFALV